MEITLKILFPIPYFPCSQSTFLLVFDEQTLTNKQTNNRTKKEGKINAQIHISDAGD